MSFTSMSIRIPTNEETPLHSEQVVVALGSNIEPREERLLEAITALDQLPRTRVVQTSRCYQSKPWGDLNQEDFLNAALWLETQLTVEELFEHLRDLEQELGKQVRRHWGPREIDLDLLLFGTFRCQSPHLTLPHPAIEMRPFVMLPLEDLGCFPRYWDKPVWSKEAESIRGETQAIVGSRLWNAQLAARNVELEISSEEETEKLAMKLSKALAPGIVVALDGELGAGKTTFTRGLCKALGLQDAVSSPSYTLCQEYREGPLAVNHWDFYRLQGENDLDSTGFEVNPDVLTIVEWAQMFPQMIDRDRHVCFTFKRGKEEESRRIIIQCPDGRGGLLFRALVAEFQAETYQ
jgi:2-amino-4-hydroxy-6-hydroxymethyldihydropteridine diphosphokinase